MSATLDRLGLKLGDEAETRLLGRLLALRLCPGDAIFLRGGLGAGKTALARAIIQALCPEEEVVSPTFTLVQSYRAPEFEILHYDLYRVESPDELWELGWGEAETAVLLVEWPERLQGLPPPLDRLEIGLTPGPSAEAREVRIDGFGSWRNRLGALAEDLEKAGIGE